ncbi:hypothetical protein [Deinococcus fonticola]|uniref:hypothetical protein n=1 Tax=Deinococcus fonticola TaxID=2528713 RepID=UPI001075503C|nr:hypothetical protein [Deinococcus fonticola]
MRLNLFIPPGVMPPATLRGMRPPFSLLLLCAALLLPVARAAPEPSPPPRCRVEAIYTPRFGSELGSLLVRIRKDLPCPESGIARIRLGQYGGPGSRATGSTETLTKQRPALVWLAQPRYRTVLWEALTGSQFNVPIQGR